jgi:hypothetical protein
MAKAGGVDVAVLSRASSENLTAKSPLDKPCSLGYIGYVQTIALAVCARLTRTQRSVQSTSNNTFSAESEGGIGMKLTALLLGVALAVLTLGSVATAANYEIVAGLNSNIIATTNWAGAAATQVGNNGWWYRSTVVSASTDPKNVYPWNPFWGDTYAWETNLSSYALMGWEHSYNSGNSAFGWSGQTAGAIPDGTKGVICNSNESAEALKYQAGNGTAVALRHDWNTTWFQPIMIEWRAATAGVADVNYMLYSAANNPASGSTSGAEFHLGIYRNGVFDTQLGWKTVIGDTNTGVGNGVALTATGIALNAGDSIVLLTRSAKYDPYGTRQDNASVAGSITFTEGSVVTPEPGSMLALGSGFLGLIGFAIRRRK